MKIYDTLHPIDTGTFLGPPLPLEVAPVPGPPTPMTRPLPQCQRAAGRGYDQEHLKNAIAQRDSCLHIL